MSKLGTFLYLGEEIIACVWHNITTKPISPVYYFLNQRRDMCHLSSLVKLFRIFLNNEIQGFKTRSDTTRPLCMHVSGIRCLVVFLCLINNKTNAEKCFYVP